MARRARRRPPAYLRLLSAPSCTRISRTDAMPKERSAKFICDCSRFCKRPKPVSRSTWYSHSSYCALAASTSLLESTSPALRPGSPSFPPGSIPSRHDRPQHPMRQNELDLVLAPDNFQLLHAPYDGSVQVPGTSPHCEGKSTPTVEVELEQTSPRARALDSNRPNHNYDSDGFASFGRAFACMKA